jgi:hypothetical protein
MPDRMTRREYLDEYWDYEPGQHVLIVAPTGAGKSYLAWQLLEKSMELNPHLKTVVFMPKPRDATTHTNAVRLGLKETPVWPPKKNIFQSKPRGHVLWPQQDPKATAEARRAGVGAELNKGLNAQYWGGNSISFIDDAHSAATMMNMNSLIEETLTNGRANGSGLFIATQKPSGTLQSGGLTSFAWGSASKMAFSRDNDERNLERLSEIGAGTDPKELREIIRNLEVFNINGQNVGEFLMIDRAGPYYTRLLPWLCLGSHKQKYNELH